MDFGLTGVEIFFLIVAVVVTIPLLFFVRFVLRELKKEEEGGPKH